MLVAEQTRRDNRAVVLQKFADKQGAGHHLWSRRFFLTQMQIILSNECQEYMLLLKDYFQLWRPYCAIEFS